MKDQIFLRGLSLKAFVGMMALGLVSIGAQAATVTVAAHDTVVAPGEQFTVDVVGVDFNDGDLDGWGLDIGFDGGLLTADSFAVDTVTWEFFDLTGTITANSIDGTAGASFASRTGNLLFGTITFTAGLIAGVSMISLAEWAGNPFGTGGGPYPNLNLDQTATITVAAVPVPAAVWMFGSALGLLGFVRRRMQRS
jgi:hypothetical protein